MVDNFRDFSDEFIGTGGNVEEILTYFGIKKSTYYSWRSQGLPKSREDQASRFFEDDSNLEWGESIDLSLFLKNEIFAGESFLNSPKESLPLIFTPRGHLWLTGVLHIRWIGGPDNGKEFDEIFSRTTGNSYNYPSEASLRMQEFIDQIFSPRNIKTKGRRPNYQVVVDWINFDGSREFFNEDGDPFSYTGSLIWNTKYTNINVQKGRKEEVKIEGRRIYK